MECDIARELFVQFCLHDELPQKSNSKKHKLQQQQSSKHESSILSNNKHTFWSEPSSYQPTSHSRLDNGCCFVFRKRYSKNWKMRICWKFKNDYKISTIAPFNKLQNITNRNTQKVNWCTWSDNTLVLMPLLVFVTDRPQRNHSHLIKKARLNEKHMFV